jgi:LysR family transcriptional regulator, nod-box dependent transcriptional activator
MRFERLDLNLLVALDALLTERNVTRAAEKIFLTQSAMSSALGRLRDYFGDPLLVQVNRTMQLSPRAEALKDPLRDVLVRIRATIATEPLFDARTSDRTFKVFASDYSLQTLVPPMLAIAAAEGGSIRFDFHPLIGSATRALDSGDADLLVVPQAYGSTDHPFELLLREEFACVVWSATSFAREGLTHEAYLAAGHIVTVPVMSEGRTYESQVFDSLGLTRRVAATTYTFASMPTMVVGTPYIATVHRRLAETFAKSHPITLLPVPFEMPPMDLIVQWHEFRSFDPGLAWLRSVLKRAVLDGEGAGPSP